MKTFNIMTKKKISVSVVEETFKEIDEKFMVLSNESREWIKMKIMSHITEAYNRGKNVKTYNTDNSEIGLDKNTFSRADVIRILDHVRDRGWHKVGFNAWNKDGYYIHNRCCSDEVLKDAEDCLILKK